MNLEGESESSLVRAQRSIGLSDDAMLDQVIRESTNNVCDDDDDEELQRVKFESSLGCRPESFLGETIDLADDDNDDGGGGKMPACRPPPPLRARSTSPAPSGERRSGYRNFGSGQTSGNSLERPRSTSPVPSGCMRVYSRIENKTMKDMYAQMTKEDRKKLRPDQKQDRKDARKRIKTLRDDSSRGLKEDVGRNVCQSPRPVDLTHSDGSKSSLGVPSSRSGSSGVSAPKQHRKSGGERIYRKLRSGTLKEIHPMAATDDMTEEMKSERKAAKKRKKMMDGLKASPNTIGVDMAMAVGVQGSAISKFADGEATGDNGEECQIEVLSTVFAAIYAPPTALHSGRAEDVDLARSSKTPAQRMEELDSLQSFLTKEEYHEKRAQILSDI